MTAYWITGNTLDVLRKMPDDSADLVLTSPPFLALRSYLPDDDPAKADEIGQEPTPGEFIDTMLDIVEELRRVLAPHGSIAIEFGDTYSGSGGAGGDYNDDGLRDGQNAFKGSASKRVTDPRHSGRDKPSGWGQQLEGWPETKSLCLIPELFRIALAYGVNPLTGRTTPRWRVRNVVRWVRPNPPVGALGDKFRPGTSEMVIACGTDEPGRTRYFDLDAVRTAVSEPAKSGGRPRRQTFPRKNGGYGDGDPRFADRPVMSNEAGAPPLDWWRPTPDEITRWEEWADQFTNEMWEIPTHGYKGSHYATFPPALCERPIKAMCPLKVCTVCGEPSRRIVSEATYSPSESYRGGAMRADAERVADGVNQWKAGEAGQASVVRQVETLGWTDCEHDAYRPGRVLDIFGGSGTTLAVATGHGRDAIGIDLDRRNIDLARERIGMFFEELSIDDIDKTLGGAA